MTKDMTVTATFEAIPPEQYTLTMAVNEAGWGTTAPSSGTHTYDEDTVVNIAATAARGVSFTGWTGDVADAASSATTVILTGDKTVTATFEAIPPEQYTLTMSVNENGLGYDRTVLRHPHL